MTSEAYNQRNMVTARKRIGYDNDNEENVESVKRENG